MKEWLTAVMDGDRMPSKNEFDMDYEEFLRDKLKNKEITEEQKKSLLKSRKQRLHFEVMNMFRLTHRLVSGQIVSFVPFLYVLIWKGIFFPRRRSLRRLTDCAGSITPSFTGRCFIRERSPTSRKNLFRWRSVRM